MHENLKHTVKKYLAIKKKNILTLRQLLPTIANTFQISYQTILILSLSYSKQYYTLFQTSNNTDTFRELLVNNTTHLSRVYIKNTDIFREFPPN